jgi:membrane protein implicated in regulation of membrane protease activity
MVDFLTIIVILLMLGLGIFFASLGDWPWAIGLWLLPFIIFVAGIHDTLREFVHLIRRADEYDKDDDEA